MVIWRCAWHRKYYGYPLLYRVTTLRDPRIVITDAICRQCNVRLREDLRVPPHVVDSSPMPLARRLLPAAVGALLVTAALLLVTRPLDVPPMVPPAVSEAVPPPLAWVETPPATREAPPARRAAPRRSSASRATVVAALPHGVALERAAWREMSASSGAWAAPVRLARRERVAAPDVMTLADRTSAGSVFGLQAP